MHHTAARLFTRASLALAALLAVSACTSNQLLEKRSAADLASSPQPVELSGEFTYSNDIFLTYHRRHAVALVDLTGFVERDQSWEVDTESLVFGRLTLDRMREKATYHIDLPLHPAAKLNRIDQNDEGGVKLYTLAYWSDPYSSYDTFTGWPTLLASIKTDPERNDEITGGQILVWSPDDKQSVPSDFGADNSLFTGDDPLQPLPAGYSVLDLDERPFVLRRDVSATMLIYERSDISTKDFSNLSYSEAFQRLFDQASKEYAFNGIEGKTPDWDAIQAELAPRVLQAEQEQDAAAFFRVIRDFANNLPDGHTYIDGGDLEGGIVVEDFGGGGGLAARELDDGRVIVIRVDPESPAERAKIEVGDELVSVNGKPVAEAISSVNTPTGPYSTEIARRYDQVRYMLRGPIGGRLVLELQKPGGASLKAPLVLVDETDSLWTTSLFFGADSTALPIDYTILDSGVGYVRINSNDDDLDLINELFLRAMDSFDYNGVPGIIIDMRRNSGGANLELAGYLTNTAIPLSLIEYYNENSQQFEPDGPPDEVDAVEDPYHFDSIAVLVGPACFSACELEAYGFSKLPNAIVVGQYPSAGVEAEVARGSFLLPEEISLQIPTGRFVNPDGSLFLEGTGVQPTLRVPVDEETVLGESDAVLDTAETAVLDAAAKAQEQETE